MRCWAAAMAAGEGRVAGGMWRARFASSNGSWAKANETVNSGTTRNAEARVMLNLPGGDDCQPGGYTAASVRDNICAARGADESLGAGRERHLVQDPRDHALVRLVLCAGELVLLIDDALERLGQV